MSTIEIRYSDDGGNNWRDWRVIDAGDTGDFVKEMAVRRLGMTRHRIWEIRDTSDRPAEILAASIQAETL